MAALADVDLASTPSDGELVEHYRSRVGDEVVGRAERLAREFIERDAVLGRLELVADRLYLAAC
jgi:hypothetical protein